MFQLTKIITKALEVDEFVPAVITGPYGWGKTAYAIKVMAEGHRIANGIPNYTIELLQKWMKWHPRDVLKDWMLIRKKEWAYIWDDAGYWLNALEWQNRYIRAISKYFNVVRTDFGCIMFTTPIFEWVAKKIREMSSMVVIEIEKIDDYTLGERPRRAIGYDYWAYIRGDHKPIFIDDFDATLPNHLFRWYYPIRKMYAKQAKEGMLLELEAAGITEEIIE